MKVDVESVVYVPAGWMPIPVFLDTDLKSDTPKKKGKAAALTPARWTHLTFITLFSKDLVKALPVNVRDAIFAYNDEHMAARSHERPWESRAKLCVQFKNSFM